MSKYCNVIGLWYMGDIGFVEASNTYHISMYKGTRRNGLFKKKEGDYLTLRKQ